MTTAQLEDQRMSALARGNEIRGSNARIKKLIASLPRERAFKAVATIVRTPSEGEGAMKVEPLLRSIPRVGDTEMRRMAARFFLKPGVRLRDLPPHRRELLAQYLEGRSLDASRRPVQTRMDPSERRTEHGAVLRAIVKCGGPVLCRDISGEAGLRSLGAGQKLAAMERAGLVVRSRGSDERLLWDVTAAGREMVP